MPLIASRGEKQTPWVEGMNYKHLEMLGWVKYDLLGLETLRIIRRTIELIIANESKTRKRKELTLEDGKKIQLFGDQLVKTNRGNIRVDELTTSDEILEMPILS